MVIKSKSSVPRFRGPEIIKLFVHMKKEGSKIYVENANGRKGGNKVYNNNNKY